MIKTALPMLVLAACESNAGDSVQPAKNCVTGQVQMGKKVSATEARQVVGNCRTEIDRWAVEGLRQRPGVDFDLQDPSIAQEIEDRRQAIEDEFLTSLSDELQPRTVVM